MTVFGLVVLVTLNILMFAIVIIALAGTKGKLDTVDIMFRHWAKRQGVAPRKRFTEKDYDAIEYLLNQGINKCQRINDNEFDEDNVDRLIHYQEIVENIRK